MAEDNIRTRVGEVRPSQLLHTFGVGAIIDLPNISALVMGLDDWDKERAKEITEDRLLVAVQDALGPQLERLISPPMPPEADQGFMSATDENSRIGVPVAPFPRWMRCRYCGYLGPMSSGLFRLRTDPYYLDRTRYVHVNCPKAEKPAALAVRFLVACDHGHLDDFPWIRFVHPNGDCAQPVLSLFEYGVTGEPSDISVKCQTCGKERRLAEAFGDDGQKNMPTCRGRRPHLRDFEENGCDQQVRTITLGASNSWFPVQRSALSIPVEGDVLQKLIDQHWDKLKRAKSIEVVDYLRDEGKLVEFVDFPNEKLWQGIKKRQQEGAVDAEPSDLKGPEWQVLISPYPERNSPDFQLREVGVPRRYANYVSKVVLADRLREVSALLGFTRIESPNDYLGAEQDVQSRRVPLSRKPPSFVPSIEVRGEGIFVALREDKIVPWVENNDAFDQDFLQAHRLWCKRRHIENPDQHYPGLRYVLLHSFAHALMRQLSLESGYMAASIRERVYASSGLDDGVPMAGVLLYTAAPDSEGTLGGLVRMGETDQLGRHIDQALEQMRLCTSDPLCAEHRPDPDGSTLHGAACHACLFAPETSCERGNKFLGRSTLVETVHEKSHAFFI